MFRSPLLQAGAVIVTFLLFKALAHGQSLTPSPTPSCYVEVHSRRAQMDGLILNAGHVFVQKIRSYP